MTLDKKQIAALRSKLEGRLISVCFGSGVDSTAMLVALRDAGIKPDLITFADTGGEKPETLVHLGKVNAILESWGWPTINVCKKTTLPSTSYDDLYGNCLDNETLPSLAFGMKSCSIKWKQVPQDQFIKGIKSGANKSPAHPIWIKAQATGQRIVKLIGYDCGKADLRRSKKPTPADAEFDYIYPLQIVGWARKECVMAITEALGAELVPVKSACFFCPASKIWELFWLAGHYPDLLQKALVMERKALTGRHSRFDSLEFGESWESMVLNADRFPSTNTCVGLGRSFAWNQWAKVNNVVDHTFTVRTSQADKQRFLEMAALLQTSDNALDVRLINNKTIPIVDVTAADVSATA